MKTMKVMSSFMGRMRILEFKLTRLVRSRGRKKFKEGILVYKAKSAYYAIRIIKFRGLLFAAKLCGLRKKLKNMCGKRTKES